MGGSLGENDFYINHNCGDPVKKVFRSPYYTELHEAAHVQPSLINYGDMNLLSCLSKSLILFATKPCTKMIQTSALHMHTSTHAHSVEMLKKD